MVRMQPNHTHTVLPFAEAVATGCRGRALPHLGHRVLQPDPLRPSATQQSPFSRTRTVDASFPAYQQVDGRSTGRKQKVAAEGAAAAAAAAEAATATAAASEDAAARGGGTSKGKARRKRRNRTEEEESSGAADAGAEGGAAPAPRRRRGDDEFEQQLAMAVRPHPELADRKEVVAVGMSARE